MLSIVIPVYKVEEFIVQCIISCLEQKDVVLGIDYEIIIVDDGSPDQSINKILPIIKDSKGIYLLVQTNSGLSAARNKGLSYAKGDYIWFIDSDDWIREDAVKVILTKLGETDNPDILKFRSVSVYQDGTQQLYQSPYNEKKILLGIDAGINFMTSTPVQFSIYRKSLLLNNKISFIEGILHEDVDFTPKIYWFAKTVGFCNDILYYYRQNPSSISNVVKPQRAFDLIVVSNSLAKFQEDVIHNYSAPYTSAIANLICTAINNALFIIIRSSHTDQVNFNHFLHTHKYLFDNLKRGTFIKFKIEWLLFKLYPFIKYTQVYKFFKLMKP